MSRPGPLTFINYEDIPRLECTPVKGKTGNNVFSFPEVPQITDRPSDWRPFSEKTSFAKKRGFKGSSLGPIAERVESLPTTVNLKDIDNPKAGKPVWPVTKVDLDRIDEFYEYLDESKNKKLFREVMDELKQ